MDVRCLDGTVLTLRTVPVLARDGAPYEVTLSLLLDGEPFGTVGERCGGILAAAAQRLRAGLVSTLEAGVHEAGLGEEWPALAPYLPRDRELFALRARDPDDVEGAGALRALLDVRRRWERGWVVDTRVVLEAWGDQGRGVRAALTPQELLAVVEGLVRES